MVTNLLIWICYGQRLHSKLALASFWNHERRGEPDMCESNFLLKQVERKGNLDFRKVQHKDSSSDCRCACGSLMAKITPQGVEIKCRRCKRLQVIPNREMMGHWTVLRGLPYPP